MSDSAKPRLLSERQVRWMLNFYPPLWFLGVKVTHIAPGFEGCRVALRRRLRTRNLNGTIFGGAIFSAADPMYAILLWQALAHRGLRARVWLKSATIQYIRPADDTLTLDCPLDAELIDRAADALRAGERFVHTWTIDAIAPDGEVCARIDTEVHVR